MIYRPVFLPTKVCFTSLAHCSHHSFLLKSSIALSGFSPETLSLNVRPHMVLSSTMLPSTCLALCNLPVLLRSLVKDTPLEAPFAHSSPVYLWRDERGAWQVTDDPPPEGTPYEIKQYRLDANILPALEEPNGGR